jgi:hypothetical protein
MPPHSLIIDLTFVLVAPSSASTVRQISNESLAELSPEEILLEGSSSGDQREENQQNQQMISQMKTKQRDQEKIIGSLKHKEVC